MKKLYLFALAATMALFSACSSNDDVAEVADVAIPGFNAEGKGYMSISLNLPQTNASSSRANDDFNDGSADEYAVKNAILILFDADKNVHSYYSLGGQNGPDNWGYNWANPNNVNWSDIVANSNVTKTAVLTISANEGKLPKYAFVFVNVPADSWAVDGTKPIGGGSLTICEKPIDTNSAVDETKNDFETNLLPISSNMAFMSTGGGGTGFYMCNAVLSDKSGSADPTGAKVTVLAEIDQRMIKPTKELAEKEGVAAVINVERGMAKVTLSNNITTGTTLTLNGSGETTYALPYKVTKWTLGNKETYMYVVRNWDNNAGWLGHTNSNSKYKDVNPYRFVGTQQIVDTYLYRTYWGKSVHYGDLGLTASDVAAIGDWTAPSTSTNSCPLYCRENTFPVENMKIKNTTCAVVEVQFGEDNKDLFNVNDVYYTEADFEYMVVRALSDLVETYEVTDASGNVTNVFPKFPWDSDNTKKLEGTITVESITYSPASTAGTVKVSEVVLKGSESGDAKCTFAVKTNSADPDGVLDKFNNAFAKITHYVEGKAYYYTPIKHFGDDLTPWTATNTGGIQTTNYNANDHLGRYGVLRNNWYDIEVTGVSKMGTATPPSIWDNDDYDDDVESFLSLRINILSWAKRTQTATLK